MNNSTTPYEKQLSEFTEFKESLLDRLELLFEFSKSILKDVKPSINYIVDGLIVNNFALIRYSDSIISPVITFKDIETQVETEIAKIIINNVDEFTAAVKEYYTIKTTLEQFENKSVSSLTPENTVILERVEMDMRADIIENTVESKSYELKDGYTLNVTQYATRKRLNVDINIFKNGSFIRSESIPKDDLFSRIAFIISEI